jgi:hypothetical protein
LPAPIFAALGDSNFVHAGPAPAAPSVLDVLVGSGSLDLGPHEPSTTLGRSPGFARVFARAGATSADPARAGWVDAVCRLVETGAARGVLISLGHDDYHALFAQWLRQPGSVGFDQLVATGQGIARNLDPILGRLRAAGCGQVVVVGIVDWGFTPAVQMLGLPLATRRDLADSTRLANEAIAQVCHVHAARFVDVALPFQTACVAGLAGLPPSALFQADRIHPAGPLASLMAHTIAARIDAAPPVPGPALSDRGSPLLTTTSTAP